MIFKALSELVLVFGLGLAAAAPVFAEPLIVLTTIPDLAEVVREVGGEEVRVEPLLTGAEDPHFFEANPALIAKVSRADVVCAVGLELEIGWLPKVLARSGNAKIQPGGTGHCEAGKHVTVLDKPVGQVDRSQGDVHPFGNPHYNLSPKALGEAATSVAEALSRVRPASAEEFRKNKDKFVERMAKLTTKITALLSPASGTKFQFMEYHREFAYFFNLYGLKSAGTVEEKPGVLPSAGHLAKVSSVARAKNVRLVLAARFSPGRQLDKFKELIGIEYVKLPTLVQARGEPASIEALQLAIADAILKAARP